jgi:hypothetical protein
MDREDLILDNYFMNMAPGLQSRSSQDVDSFSSFSPDDIDTTQGTQDNATNGFIYFVHTRHMGI